MMVLAQPTSFSSSWSSQKPRETKPGRKNIMLKILKAYLIARNASFQYTYAALTLMFAHKHAS